MLFAISFLFFVACEKYSFDPPQLDPNKTISFSGDIIPFFNAKCVSCHGGSLPPNLSPDKAYSTLKTRGYLSSDLTNSPETSKIYTKLAEGHAPNATNLELQTLLQWIRQGAKNN